ncbi:MAG: hypothetical protein RLZZ272_1261 [Actinomycetota bacterium]
MADGSVTRAPLVVLGAGPAGVAAASAAASVGVPVLVLDQAERPGGQLHRREALGLGAARPHGLDASGARFAREVTTLAALPDVRIASGVRVWAARTGTAGLALATDDATLGTVVSEALVLATGAHERTVPFPGWDLPGVLTVGGAQALLKGQGVLPGRAVVVAGAGPLLLPVAAALAASGAGLVAVTDAAARTRWIAGGLPALPVPKLVEGARYTARLARHGIVVRSRTAAIAAHGDGRVEEVVLARLDDDWRPIAGSERTCSADALATSHGFAPDLAVALAFGCRVTGGVVPAVAVDADQATDVRGVWAAGEVCGIAGGEVGAHEGTIAGLAAAAALGASVDRRRLERARRLRRRDEPFVAALSRVLEVPTAASTWAGPDTVVCRCEEVTRGEVDAAISGRGAGDLRSIKLTTRCGMGYCQGRICAPNVAALLEAATGAPPSDAGALSRRPVLTPVELGRLLR